MSITLHNKKVVRKLYEETLNQRKWELLPELIAEEYVGPRGVGGAAGFKEPVLALMKAVPDVQWNIQEQLMAEADKVMVYWKVKGTHCGPFLHISATGKKVSNDGTGIFILKDGKIISAQVHTDRLGFLQQLEVLPVDLTLLSNMKSHPDRVYFIDKFMVPHEAKQEFTKRVNINRNFIKTLPGFIEDTAYERTDEPGNITFVTVAVWKNEDALNKAKEAVQAEYEKQGFNPAEMLERLNITLDRGIYEDARLLP